MQAQLEYHRKAADILENALPGMKMKVGKTYSTIRAVLIILLHSLPVCPCVTCSSNRSTYFYQMSHHCDLCLDVL